MATPSFAYLAVFAVVIALLYAAISHPPTPRQCLAWVLGLASVIPLYGGATLVLAEERRARDGRTVSGAVVEKVRPTETSDGSNRVRRRRGGQALVRLVKAAGYEIPDAIARFVATGSPRTWTIEYRYDCGAAMCRGRDVVGERLWSELTVGEAVDVRPAGGHADAPRLAANSPWPPALARIGVGLVLVLGAGFASGRVSRAVPEYLTVPAVVTAVDPVDYGQAVRWRIRFAYFAPDGTALESADEVIAAGLEPGDECIAVYPPGQPDLGTLRLVQRA